MDVQINGRDYYTSEGRKATPNPVQQWVLDAAFSKPIDELFVFGGFGSGKTQTLAWTLWKGLRLGYHFWNGKRLARPRYFIASSDGSQLRTVTMPAFEAAFNCATGHDGPFWSNIKSKRNPLVLAYSRDDRQFELPWAMIRLATGHNACQAIEGANFVGGVGDEGPLWHPLGLDRSRRRVRQVGYPFRFLAHFATPQPGRALADIKTRFQDCQPYKVKTEDGYGRCRIMMPTALNLANLPDNYLALLASGHSPQMAAAILRGELVIMEGRVYPTYDGGSIIDYDWTPDRKVVCGYDPGFHRPHLSALQQIEEGGPWCVFDEISVADVSRDYFAELLCNKPWIGSCTEIVEDPAADQASTSGESDRAALKRYLQAKGYHPQIVHATHPEDRIKTYRYERLRSWLRDGNDRRGLFVERRLARGPYGTGNDGYPIAGIHMALEEQTLKKGSDDADRSEKEDHKSHPVDALGYVAVRYNPVTRVGREQWRKHRKASEAQRDEPSRKTGMLAARRRRRTG
jgi:hypothetical protein